MKITKKNLMSMNHYTTHARVKLLERVSKLASIRVEDAVIWAKKIIKQPVLKKKDK